MDWRRRPGEDRTDPHGVADLLLRACALPQDGPGGAGSDAADGSAAVEGTRFLFRTPDMVAASRTIERAAFLEPDVPLFVGVQRGGRLEAQQALYRPLLDAGVEVHAFGTDAAPDLPGIRWVQVPDDPYTLASQWFVVRDGARPGALVGFELSVPGDPHRTWEGFRSGDRHLVHQLALHLADLSGSLAVAV